MPELPEVETIKRGLTKFILHKKLTRIVVLENKSFNFDTVGLTRDYFFDISAESSRERNRDSLSGNAKKSNIGSAKVYQNSKDLFVSNLRRFGKALIIDLDNGYSLMIHLRMTGQLIWRGQENYAGGHPSENFLAALPNKQTRVIFEFEDGKLYFNDQRKFGFVKVIKTTEVENDNFIQKLAKEPWQMSPDEFKNNLMKHKNTAIKSALLDQSTICGLGNIYADETLFFAGIHPARKVGELTDSEILRILEGARATMQKSIDSGGSTMATYVKADGTRGDYLEKFAEVFRREGEKCRKCGETIIKIRVAGRGTHICPNCQKEAAK